MSKQQLSAAEKAKMDQGVQFGMNMLKLVPSDDPLALEAHITGVLVAFMGAMWGTLGTEYARGASWRRNCAAWKPTCRTSALRRRACSKRPNV